MKRNNRKFDFRTSFIDVLLNVLTSIIFIFAIYTTIVNINKAKEEGIQKKAEYIATVTWDDKINCDVDLWARDPNGVVVSYQNKDQGMMNLERDDLGLYNDALSVATNVLGSLMQGVKVDPKISDQYNEETLVYRGIQKGKYLLNVSLFSCTELVDGRNVPYKPHDPYALKVHLKLMKINPYKIVYTTDIDFSYIKEEINLVEFEIDDNKNVVSFDKSPVKLIKETSKW